MRRAGVPGVVPGGHGDLRRANTDYRLGGATLWLVLGLSDDRRLRWLVGTMLAVALALTVVITPPIISNERSLDFVPRDPPPPSLATFGVLHAAYTSLEMLKAALGACAAYRICRRTGAH